MSEANLKDLKRRRSFKDDNLEYMPLSKRINSINLNQRTDYTENPQTNEIPDCFITPPGSVQTNYADDPSLTNSEYAPTMNKSQNPFYFESNRLLFDLYLERSNRRGNAFTQSS